MYRKDLFHYRGRENQITKSNSRRQHSTTGRREIINETIKKKLFLKRVFVFFMIFLVRTLFTTRHNPVSL